jgi:hypothetical protein
MAEAQNELKFSGYVQTQWTWNQAEITNGHQNDFTIRRGRLKAIYANPYGEAVVQIDASESGISLKDAYLKLKAPSIRWGALRAGVFDRPFGYEISYSSSRRESPERSRIFLTLFPKERDLGGEIILEPLKGFALHAGLFSGNGGQAKETDSRKDFIGHLSYEKKWDNVNVGLGVSLYAGGVRLAGDEAQKAYKLEDGQFVEDTGLQAGSYAKRTYYGVDGQVSTQWGLGTTRLTGEYLWGNQPGVVGNSKSPTGVVTNDIYQRAFNGGYVQLAHDILDSKHGLVVKYDRYDPNTKLSGNDCQTAGDIAYSSWGFGWLFHANKNVRITAYYETTSNEKVANHAIDKEYATNLKDDVFTLRIQYKF